MIEKERTDTISFHNSWISGQETNWKKDKIKIKQNLDSTKKNLKELILDNTNDEKVNPIFILKTKLCIIMHT